MTKIENIGNEKSSHSNATKKASNYLKHPTLAVVD
jgi:hypothetical protein